ncbi:Phage minor capsid protein 2 [Microbacterium ginsengisoli]|uniref:Phage minor capsid protein 2 n=1 Tax=Microbacterium ginsengisoli TaxID=400772 RepID=A0A0F0LUT2_9MICO|nr:phage minor capsid protein [Microbacterium ginsengisoli]KJL37057.1 Phage minor capsid protein 2 [Microbacterium ginsengisoli]
MAQQPSEPSSQQIAAALIGLYVLAEHELLAGLTAVLRAPWSVQRDAMILNRARLLVRQVLTYLTARSTPMLQAMVTAASAEGRRDAELVLERALRAGGGAGGRVPPGRDVTLPGGEPFDLSLSHGERAARAIRDDITSSLADVRFRITRLPDDIYKMIAPNGAIRQVLDNQVTPAQAQAMAWRVFVSQGITGFTDKSGRNWSLSAYVEMAVRTAATRAYNASHLARMQALGVEYFTVDDTGHPCPLCFPWQGRVLTFAPVPFPALPVDATIAEATAAGLFHPNAILGNGPVRVLGEAENGVKAWYSGPSVHLTTARGHDLTVSPDHPVLTATGWLPAKALREGMQVFSTASSERPELVPVPDVNLHDPQTTFEDELDALAALGGLARVPAAADDLHGDGRFIQGEIEVVVADRRLLPIVESRGVEQGSESDFVRADVQALLGTGARAALLDSLCVHGAVARTLADADAAVAETPTDRRVADAESVSEILSGLAAGVEPDELVNVEFLHFEGHAYDLQTSTGAYVASSILVHNCRHTLLPVYPGVTVLPEPQVWAEEMQANYDLSQKQRRLELEVRKAKRQLEFAVSPETRADARTKVQAGQAKIRDFIAETGFARDSRREQVDLTDGRIKLPTPIR